MTKLYVKVKRTVSTVNDTLVTSYGDMQEAFAKCCSLESVTILGFIINEQFLRSMSNYCKLLKYIKMDDACISDEILLEIGSNCSLLESVQIYEFQNGSATNA